MLHYKTPTLYVSANQKDDSTDSDAAQQLSSQEHAALRADTPGGHDALGRWIDGSEASRVHPYKHPLEAAVLGAKYKQKQVLIFRSDDNGPDSRYIYRKLGDHYTPAEIRQVLADHGMPEFHTLDEHGDVHIVNKADFGLTPPPVKINGQRPEVAKGYATFLPETAESREKSVKFFLEMIRDAKRKRQSV